MVAAESSARRFSRDFSSFIDGGRMKIETMSARIFSLSCLAPCQSMSNSMSRPLRHRRLGRLARRAVAIAMHLGPFQQRVGIAQALEFAHRQEMIVDAVDLAAAPRRAW